jgi:hypothetical protein
MVGTETRLLRRSIARRPTSAKQPMAVSVNPDALGAIRNRFRSW